MATSAPQRSASPPNTGTAINTLDTWGRVTAYVALAIGFLVAILTAIHLTVIGFAALTIAYIFWLAIFHWLYRDDLSYRHHLLAATLLIIATLLGGAGDGLGLGYDWLFPVVTISVIVLMLPVRDSLLMSVVLYGLSAVVMYLTWGKDNLPNFFVSNLTLAPAYLFSFVFSLVVRQQHEQRARAESLVAQLEEAQAQLQAYAAEVEELSATRERNRMAREIHDTLGHYLTLLAAQLETAIKLEQRGAWSDPQLRAELIEARRVATECLAAVRQSVAALRPTGAISGTFEESLRRLVAEAQMSHLETAITLDVEGDTSGFSPELRVALYRCAQEALTNVRKHAHATHALVRLRVDPGRSAELTILDDGAGASGSANQQTPGETAYTPGFGLQGMRERIALLGGSVTARPEGARGWRVEAHVPLMPAQPAQEPLIGEKPGVQEGNGAPAAATSASYGGAA